MQQIPIPAGFDVGTLIGSGGSNCKELQRRFGTWVKVDSKTMVVTCSGGCHQEAAAAIRRQIASVTAGSLGAYPHPQECLYVLPRHTQYCFVPYYGPATPQLGVGKRPLQLHTLQPSDSHTSSGNFPAYSGYREDSISSSISALTDSFAAQRLTAHGTKCMQILVRPAADSLQRIVDAAEKAAAHRPAFDEIKMRYVIGQQTFYESRATKSAAALCNRYDSPTALSACVIGHDGDFKSMFCDNAEAVVRRAELDATRRLGFRLAQTKLHVSVHLKDYGSSNGCVGGVVVSLRVDDTDAAACTVRKIKSSTAKPIVVAYHSKVAGGPDFRLKLLAQYHVKAHTPDVGDAAWSYARACRWSPSQQAIVLPTSSRFVVDVVRTKAKRVYSGTFQGHELRFTSTVATDAKETHLQLGGCAVAVQEALKDMANRRSQFEGGVKAMVAFCDALVG